MKIFCMVPSKLNAHTRENVIANLFFIKILHSFKSYKLVQHFYQSIYNINFYTSLDIYVQESEKSDIIPLI